MCVLLYGLQDSLSVLRCLQTDLLTDYIGILSLHLGSSFRFSLYTQELILVPQLHLVLYRRYKNHDTRSTWTTALQKFRQDPVISTTVVKSVPFLMASCFCTDSSCLRRFSSFKACCWKKKTETVISLVLQLISKLFILNMEEVTSPVALVGPHIAVWPAYLGTELSVVRQKQLTVTTKL